MSDESPPKEDAPLTREEAERLGEERLQEVLAGGGKLTKRHKCTKCGEYNYVETDVMDTTQMVKVLQYFADQRKGDGKSATSRFAQLLQQDVSEMTNEQLAELIVSLEA